MATKQKENPNVVIRMFELAAKDNAAELANLIVKRKDRSFLEWINSKGRKLIHVAALNGSTSCLFQLIHHGNDIDSKCALGNTSLHYACMAGSLPTIIVLLHLGGNFQVINKNGEIPIDLIPSDHQAEFITLLQEIERERVTIREFNHNKLLPYQDFPIKIDSQQFAMDDIYPVPLITRQFMTDFSKEMAKGTSFVFCRGKFESEHVVVKYIPDNLYTKKLYRLLNEVSVLGKLRHPNIMLLLGIASQPNSTFQLAFEDTYSFLHQLLFETNFDLISEEILRISRDISSALNYIHHKGYTHCSVGSHSIVLNDKLNAKLCNFEHAQILSDAKPISHLTSSHSYMAPAQLNGHVASAANDMYGLGISIFECTTRKQIHEVKSMLKNMSRRETVSFLLKMIPKMFESSIPVLVSSCLEKPENRVSAVKLCNWIGALLDGGLASQSPFTFETEDEDFFPINF